MTTGRINQVVRLIHKKSRMRLLLNVAHCVAFFESAHRLFSLFLSWLFFTQARETKKLEWSNSTFVFNVSKCTWCTIPIHTEDLVCALLSLSNEEEEEKSHTHAESTKFVHRPIKILSHQHLGLVTRSCKRNQLESKRSSYIAHVICATLRKLLCFVLKVHIWTNRMFCEPRHIADGQCTATSEDLSKSQKSKKGFAAAFIMCTFGALLRLTHRAIVQPSKPKLELQWFQKYTSHGHTFFELDSRSCPSFLPVFTHKNRHPNSLDTKADSCLMRFYGTKKYQSQASRGSFAIERFFLSFVKIFERNKTQRKL